MRSNTLLIIGGTGFFGNSILKYISNSKSLKKKFKKIIIISRKRFQKFDYIKKLKKNYKIVKINSDISKVKKLPLVDYVIYAAILKNYKNDYLAVKNYTNLATRYHKQSRILYVSSGAVYGVQKKNKGIKEDYLNFNKKINFKRGYKNSYANSKFKSEKLFKKLGTSGIKVTIARCFTFVGEFLPLNSKFIIGNFIKNILNKKKITISANYQICRSYMYSDDLVKWLLKILNHSSTSCPTYNVGSDNIVSLQRLAQILAQKYNLEKSIPKSSNKIVDRYIPCINKATKVLKLRNNFDSIQAVIKAIKLIQNEKK
jgi:dTDP-glucose 4,6-dehydratase